MPKNKTRKRARAPKPTLDEQLAELQRWQRWITVRASQSWKQVANFVKMIGAGEYSVAVSAALKAAETELAHLKALTPARLRSSQPREPIERRVKRMREQLARGGEIAQGVLRELFPIGCRLYPDPNGGRYLWARTQTALREGWCSKRDGNGHLPAEHWPRVYSERVGPPLGTAAVVAAIRQGENSMVTGERHSLPGCI